MGGASRAVHEVSMTTAPSIFVIGDYGMLPPTTTTTTSSSSPNAHMNTVSIRKVWGRVGERCKQREREEEMQRKEREVVGFFLFFVSAGV